MESSLQSIQNLVCNVLVALNGGVAVGSGLRTGNPLNPPTDVEFVIIP